MRKIFFILAMAMLTLSFTADEFTLEAPPETETVCYWYTMAGDKHTIFYTPHSNSYTETILTFNGYEYTRPVTEAYACQVCYIP